MTVNREDLKAFIDGELTAMEAEAIRHEVDTNNAVSQEVVFLKLIGQGVRDCAVDIPVAGAEETLARFRKKQGFSLLQLGLIVIVVAMLSAILSPVFSQAKNASNRSSLKVMARNPSRNADVSAMADGVMSRAASPSHAEAANAKSSIAYFLGARQDSGRSTGTLNSNGETETVASPNSPAPTPTITPGDRNRMVIQNGNLDEVVRDVSSAQNEAMDYVKALGGFVQSSSMNKSQSDIPEANLDVRIPARTFAMAMDHFKSLAIDSSHIKSVNVTGEDVTAQYADSNARIRVLSAEEDSYVTMLRGARKLGEILEIKDRLSSVRQQIESLKAQSESLKNESDLSSVSLTFEQQPKVNDPVAQPSSWSSDTWTSAVNGLEAVLQFLATVMIFVFVYSPIWLPVALVGTWMHRRSR